MKKRLQGVCRVLFCVLAAALVLLPFLKSGGGRYAFNTVSASAASGDYIEVQAYDIEMTVREDRKLEVKEKITVRFLRHGLTMFYRSLPTVGARYSDIVATCEGNDAFEYYVDDNPDVDDFIDINCVGNADYGNTWTYGLSYIMEQGTSVGGEGMIVDVVGFGWTVPLHNVTATVYLPAAPTEYEVHTDMFGAATSNEVTYAVNGNVVTMSCALLDLVYNAEYDETVAGGVTLEFTMPEGTLKSYVSTRMFTDDMWKLVLGGVAALLLSGILLILTKVKRDVVTVVNVKAPDDMDPLKMGKWLDGTVNNEDITSMLYYFANKGYIRIDFTNEHDPELIREVEYLPETATAYERTLFNGLFENARVIVTQPFEEAAAKERRVAKVSEAAGHFYESMQIATKQVPNPPTMYEKKSVFGYFGGALVGVLLALLAPLLMSLRLGGGYTYFLGISFAFPIFLIVLIGYLCENYRYKWKRGKRMGLFLLQIAIAVIWTLLVSFFGFAEHIMTEYEKLVLCACAFGSCFVTQSALSRTEAYLEVLGEILGFKEFIVVTEEDKIKVMLEENPELYYKVLPYAQVLGVTNEWEGKFANLLLEPPYWYVGPRATVFDYYILNRCLNRAMLREIAALQAKNSGGGIGRSGGGGSFGGFGGGGFGGGGGGAR